MSPSTVTSQDSAPIRTKAAKPSPGTRDAFGTSKDIKIKSFVALFLLFIFVSSDIFINYAVGGVGGTLNGRQLTLFGTVVQGVLLVMFYISFLHLEEARIL